MSNKNLNYEQKALRNRIIFIPLAVIVAIVTLSRIVTEHPRWNFLVSSPDNNNITTANKPEQDSVKLAHSQKVPASEFQSNYSAEKWYAEFAMNKVAFDKANDEKTIDIHGTIYQITNDDDCSRIVMKGIADEPFNEITFLNCGGGTDHWSDEVAKTAVGQDVHIRGIYSGFLSSSYEMSLYKCHIINDN
ncbi:hypothetical protein CKK33_04180 [Mucilaginibacter sp. MD40]|uniref:OB-fold protein n=1 Tax=Mucilaginibacter sp. MD40 TaxID=2029590 RepID=UPI000BACC158|nr:hypothetical protein [Mucilaginibacter sp. MD40]PAW92736.1 hypothetical protein CKK33_04180 [Mucilaginibacter sp. MD40]